MRTYTIFFQIKVEIKFLSSGFIDMFKNNKIKVFATD